MKGFRVVSGDREKPNTTVTQQHPSQWSEMSETEKEKTVHELLQECFARGNDTDYLTEEIRKLLQNN